MPVLEISEDGIPSTIIITHPHPRHNHKHDSKILFMLSFLLIHSDATLSELARS
jgi:hypothetical protein